jgi:CHRD domain/PEP-CTERM motif
MKHVILSIAGLALACLATPAGAATVYGATLLGANENPAVVSPATGSSFLSLNGDILSVRIIFQGLTTPLADGHIHCCAGPTANTGVAIGFGGLPLGSTSGTYFNTFNLSNASVYRAAFLTASGGTAALAKARLLSAFDNKLAYVNVHSQRFPGGEIRGQVGAIPEPATWSMMISGFGLAGVALRRRRRQGALA